MVGKQAWLTKGLGVGRMIEASLSGPEGYNPWKESSMGKTACYLCTVRDPNEVHYDPEKHHVCMICGIKLWELARNGLEFDARDSTVVVGLKSDEDG